MVSWSGGLKLLGFFRARVAVARVVGADKWFTVIKNADFEEDEGDALFVDGRRVVAEAARGAFRHGDWDHERGSG